MDLPHPVGTLDPGHPRGDPLELLGGGHADDAGTGGGSDGGLLKGKLVEEAGIPRRSADEPLLGECRIGHKGHNAVKVESKHVGFVRVGVDVEQIEDGLVGILAQRRTGGIDEAADQDGGAQIGSGRRGRGDVQFLQIEQAGQILLHAVGGVDVALLGALLASGRGEIGEVVAADAKGQRSRSGGR